MVREYHNYHVKEAIMKANQVWEVLDYDEVFAAAEEQMFGTGTMGFCVECGAESYNCEPDAAEYVCDACGERRVFGATEIMVRW